MDVNYIIGQNHIQITTNLSSIAISKDKFREIIKDFNKKDQEDE